MGRGYKKIPHLVSPNFIIIGGNSVQIQSVPDILDKIFRCVTVTKLGCQTDKSIQHVTGHRGCQIDSNGTVTDSTIYHFTKLPCKGLLVSRLRCHIFCKLL